MRRGIGKPFVGSPVAVKNFVKLFPRTTTALDAPRRCACGCSPRVHNIDGNKVLCPVCWRTCAEVFGLGEFAAMASRWAGGQR